MTKIIVIEGIDGTGKTVQLINLEKRLSEKGYKVKTLSFPAYDTFFGAEIGKLLSAREGVSAADVDAKSMSLWFAMDRFDSFRSFDYSDADYLLLNRYVLSNAVYQSIRDRDIGKPDILDFVMELEHKKLGLPIPDRYIVLDMDMEAASGNVMRKGFRDYVGGEKKDVYESTDGIQARAQAKYREYAARLPNVSIINCMGPDGLMSIEAIGHKIDETLAGII